MIKPIPLKAFLAALSTILFFSLSSAQTFHTIKATSQNWAGGVAGHHGVNYYIELETKLHTAIPDTVWINGDVFPLNYKTKQGNLQRSYDSVTHEIKYVIIVGEAHNDFGNVPNRLRNNQKTDSTAAKPKPIRQFTGAAMISYRFNRRQHFFIIKSFTTLDPLNYP